MKVGDRVEIETLDADGTSLFGTHRAEGGGAHEAATTTGARRRRWRVRIALGLKGLAYEYVAGQPASDGGEQHARRRTARSNPMAQVPTLELDETGGVARSRSRWPILEYLEETLPDAAAPAARSVPARARARSSPRSSTPASSRCRTCRRSSAVDASSAATTRDVGRSASSRAGSTALERAAARRAGTFLRRRRADDRRRAASCRSSTPRAASSVDVAPLPAARARSKTRCIALPAFQNAHPIASPTRVAAGVEPWPSSSRSVSSSLEVAPLLRATTSSASRRFYVDKLDFAETGAVVARARARGPAAARPCSRPATSTVVVLASRSARAGAPRASCAKHPDGVGTLVFEVEDIERTFRLLERARRHADHRRPDASATTAARCAMFSITTPFGDTTFRFVERTGYRGALPGLRAEHAEPIGGTNTLRLPARSITSRRTSRP